MKRLLALDQATAITGYSIWEDGKLVKWGKQKFEGETIDRVSQVRQWLIKMVEALKADGSDFEVILEGIQLQQDVDMFKTLAWLQGTLLVTLFEMEIKTRVFFSTEWKSTCGVKGKGRTEQKQNAQKHVVEKYGIKATQDECDAICIGEHTFAEDDKVVNWG